MQTFVCLKFWQNIISFQFCFFLHESHMMILNHYFQTVCCKGEAFLCCAKKCMKLWLCIKNLSGYKTGLNRELCCHQCKAFAVLAAGGSEEITQTFTKVWWIFLILIKCFNFLQHTIEAEINQSKNCLDRILSLGCDLREATKQARFLYSCWSSTGSIHSERPTTSPTIRAPLFLSFMLRYALRCKVKGKESSDRAKVQQRTSGVNKMFTHFRRQKTSHLK